MEKSEVNREMEVGEAPGPAEGAPAGTESVANGEAGDGAVEASARLRALEQEVDSLKGALLRARADYDNYRKRAARESAEIGARTRAEMILPLLETLDDLDRALADAAAESSPMRAGVALIRENMRRRLADAGVSEIPAVGERFDPNVHEAVGRVEDASAAPDTILHEVQRGYLLGGRVLRPARAIVAVPPRTDTGGESEA